jgi:hypothetical protein
MTAAREGAPEISLEQADALVAGGDYAKALGAYRNLLEHAPGDRRAHQRLEELRMLIRLLGREKEVRMERLEAFGRAVARRRDEFLGST